MRSRSGQSLVLMIGVMLGLLALVGLAIDGNQLFQHRRALQNLADGARNARTLLEPLMTGSAETRRERLATLRAVLEQPGFNEAAAALGVHRNTLAYRIHRIERLTGWRLADPELRLPLAIAVRLAETP